MSWEKVLKNIPEHRDDFQKWLKESYDQLVEFFKQDFLKKIPKHVTASWGSEHWAALQEDAEKETQRFIQTIAFDNKIYPNEFLQEEFKSFINKSEIKKERTMKTKHKNIVYDSMRDGKWRSAKEISEDFNLIEVWPKYNRGALVYYLKNSTGYGARSGVGPEIYEKRKVNKSGYGVDGRETKYVWEFRLKTEMIHKAKLINVNRVKLRDKKIPEEEEQEECVARLVRISNNVNAHNPIPNADGYKGRVAKKTVLEKIASDIPINNLHMHIPEDVACAALDMYDKLKYNNNWNGTRADGSDRASESAHKTYTAKNGESWYFHCYKYIYNLDMTDADDNEYFDQYIDSQIHIDLNTRAAMRSPLVYTVKCHSILSFKYPKEQFEKALNESGNGEYIHEVNRPDPIELIKEALKKMKEVFT